MDRIGYPWVTSHASWPPSRPKRRFTDAKAEDAQR
jgi:hypothetical protein